MSIATLRHKLSARPPALAAVVAQTWALLPPSARRGMALQVPLGLLTALVEFACAGAVFALIDTLVASELQTSSIVGRWFAVGLDTRSLAIGTVVLFILKGVVATLVGRHLGIVVEELRCDLMARVLGRALTAPWLVHLERGPSAVVQEVTHDAACVVDEIVLSLAAVATSLLVGLTLIAPLAIAAPVPTAFAVLGGLVWIVVMHRASRGIASALALDERASRQAASSVLAGALSALRELRSQGRVGAVVRAYRRALDGMVSSRQAQRTVAAQPRLWSESLVIIVLALLVLGGAARPDTFALLGAAAYTTMRVLPIANGAAWYLIRAQAAAPSVAALAGLAHDLPRDRALPPATGGAAVAIDDLSFGYGATPLFDGLSLRITPGELVGIVGPSGAGKSTLLGLITGTLEPLRGQVTIEGRAPREVDVRTAYVPQETALLRGTIGDNVALAIDGVSDVDDDGIRRALVVAALDNASEFPAGAQTSVGEGGAGLSGGQRQRVALARAVAHAPALLVLDEATSGLDRDTEAEVMTRLAAWAAGRCTIVIVTHRRDVAARCDRVIEIDGGRVLGALST